MDELIGKTVTLGTTAALTQRGLGGKAAVILAAEVFNQRDGAPYQVFTCKVTDAAATGAVVTVDEASLILS